MSRSVGLGRFCWMLDPEGLLLFVQTHVATAELAGQVASPPIPYPLNQGLLTPGTTPALWCVPVVLSPGPLKTLSFQGLMVYGGVGWGTCCRAVEGAQGLKGCLDMHKAPGSIPSTETAAAQGQTLARLLAETAGGSSA